MIYQFWFHRYNNVGDLLGPWIVRKLSQHEVRYASYVTKGEALRIVAGSLLRFRLPEKEYVQRLFVNSPILFTIGSILELCNEDIVVWGSGFQNIGESCRKGKFLAVRGPESLKRLQDLGFDVPDNLPVGDPALLMPLLYKPKVERRYEIGIVMHNSDREYIQAHFSNYHLIDVATNQVEKFIDDLCSCKRILTTSMHGLILSHAYGIPALWMKKNWIGSDGFKFKDYFESVGLQNISPLDADTVMCMDAERISGLFIEVNKSLPQIDLCNLQKRLLKVAPFEVNRYGKQLLHSEKLTFPE